MPACASAGTGVGFGERAGNADQQGASLDQRTLLRQRHLHGEHDLATSQRIGGIRRNRRSGRDELAIGNRRFGPCTGFDRNRQAEGDQALYRIGRRCDARLGRAAFLQHR